MTDTNALAVLVRYHETGGLEGDCSDITLAMAKAELTALHATDEHPNAEDFFNRAQRAEQALAERAAEIVRLREALTPSIGTKAAYIGEFKFPVDDYDFEGNDPVTRDVAVPWTTIKEIMAAIRNRALGGTDAVKTGEDQ